MLPFDVLCPAWAERADRRPNRLQDRTVLGDENLAFATTVVKSSRRLQFS